jgi:hypothetical protein
MSEGGVTYTVKELISMLERTLTDQMNSIAEDIKGLAGKIETKASDVRVDGLERRMAAGEERILKLELAASASSGASGVKMWAGNAAVILAASCIGALLYFIVQGAH